MTAFVKRHKYIIIFVCLDLFLFWVLFYSGIVLPFVNPSMKEYNKDITSFPRNYGQMLIWVFLHFPTSIILDTVTSNDRLLFLSVFQTGVIVYFIEKFIKWKRCC
jgi:hypothetical protein